MKKAVWLKPSEQEESVTERTREVAGCRVVVGGGDQLYLMSQEDHEGPLFVSPNPHPVPQGR